VQQFDLIRSLKIDIWRPIAGLKTKTSSRSIPLSPRATECLRQHKVELSDTDPIFPAYAKPRGNDSASAMLMKRLRIVITDKKITMHSLRYRMTDKLHNTGCPENLSMAILGHSANIVAAKYGAGYAIEVMREPLGRCGPSEGWCSQRPLAVVRRSV
jgi:integrase